MNITLIGTGIACIFIFAGLMWLWHHINQGKKKTAAIAKAMRALKWLGPGQIQEDALGAYRQIRGLMDDFCLEPSDLECKSYREIYERALYSQRNAVEECERKITAFNRQLENTILSLDLPLQKQSDLDNKKQIETHLRALGIKQLDLTSRLEELRSMGAPEN